MSRTIPVSSVAANGDEWREDATQYHGSDPEAAARALDSDYPGGAKALALAMGVNPNTLDHKLNPTMAGHKLSLNESLSMQVVSGDKRIAHAMCAALGMVATSEKVKPAGSPTERLASCVLEFGEYVSEAAKAVADGVVTPNELKRCRGELADMQAAANALLEQINGMVPDRG